MTWAACSQAVRKSAFCKQNNILVALEVEDGIILQQIICTMRNPPVVQMQFT